MRMTVLNTGASGSGLQCSRTFSGLLRTYSVARDDGGGDESDDGDGGVADDVTVIVVVMVMVMVAEVMVMMRLRMRLMKNKF